MLNETKCNVNGMKLVYATTITTTSLNEHVKFYLFFFRDGSMYIDMQNMKTLIFNSFLHTEDCCLCNNFVFCHKCFHRSINSKIMTNDIFNFIVDSMIVSCYNFIDGTTFIDNLLPRIKKLYQYKHPTITENYKIVTIVDFPKYTDKSMAVTLIDTNNISRRVYKMSIKLVGYQLFIRGVTKYFTMYGCVVKTFRHFVGICSDVKFLFEKLNMRDNIIIN